MTKMTTTQQRRRTVIISTVHGDDQCFNSTCNRLDRSRSHDMNKMAGPLCNRRSRVTRIEQRRRGQRQGQCQGFLVKNFNTHNNDKDEGSDSVSNAVTKIKLISHDKNKTATTTNTSIGVMFVVTIMIGFFMLSFDDNSVKAFQIGRIGSGFLSSTISSACPFHPTSQRYDNNAYYRWTRRSSNKFCLWMKTAINVHGTSSTPSFILGDNNDSTILQRHRHCCCSYSSSTPLLSSSSSLLSRTNTFLKATRHHQDIAKDTSSSATTTTISPPHDDNDDDDEQNNKPSTTRSFSKSSNYHSHSFHNSDGNHQNDCNNDTNKHHDEFEQNNDINIFSLDVPIPDTIVKQEQNNTHDNQFVPPDLPDPSDILKKFEREGDETLQKFQKDVKNQFQNAGLNDFLDDKLRQVDELVSNSLQQILPDDLMETFTSSNDDNSNDLLTKVQELLPKLVSTKNNQDDESSSNNDGDDDPFPQRWPRPLEIRGIFLQYLAWPLLKSIATDGPIDDWDDFWLRETNVLDDENDSSSNNKDKKGDWIMMNGFELPWDNNNDNDDSDDHQEEDTVQPSFQNKRRMTNADHVCATLEKLGPTFVKLGQTLSTRTDIIPKSLANVLATKLQDSMDPFDSKVAKDIIRHELWNHTSYFDSENELDKFMNTLSDEPVGAASIAQVYKGHLEGKDVAIKVKRPYVEELVKRDAESFCAWALWVESLKFPTPALIQTKEKQMQNQKHQEEDKYDNTKKKKGQVDTSTREVSKEDRQNNITIASETNTRSTISNDSKREDYGNTQTQDRGLIAARIADAVDEYMSRLKEELSFEKELENAQLFYEIYGKINKRWPTVIVPKCYPHLCTNNILVMEWLDGETLVTSTTTATGVVTDHVLDTNSTAGTTTTKNSTSSISCSTTNSTIERNTSTKQDLFIIKEAIESTLSQLFDVGFVHADPHGGNLMKVKSRNNGEKYKLGYVDFGMVAKVDPALRDGLVSALVQLSFGGTTNATTLTDLIEDLQLLPEETLKDPAKRKQFTELVDNLLTVDTSTSGNETESTTNDNTTNGKTKNNISLFSEEDEEENSSDKKTNVSKIDYILASISALVGQFEFRLPPYFLNNLKALLILEGMAQRIDPSYDIFAKVVYPYAAFRLLNNPRINRVVSDSVVKCLQTVEPNGLDDVNLFDPNGFPNLLNGLADVTQRSRIHIFWNIMSSRGFVLFMMRTWIHLFILKRPRVYNLVKPIKSSLEGMAQRVRRHLTVPSRISSKGGKGQKIRQKRISQ